jgi:hypothetical protein
MPMKWHTFQTQAGDGGSAGSGAGAGDAGAAGGLGAGAGGAAGGAGAGTVDPTALSAKFSEGYNDGRQKEQRDFAAILKKEFGVESLAELKKAFEDKTKGGNPDHVKQVETLTGQIQTLQQAHETERLNWRVQAAMTGLDAYDPADTAAAILKAYDIHIDETGRETIYKHGTKDLVVLDAKAATVRDLVQSLTKDGTFKWRFKSGGGTGVQTGSSTKGNTQFTDEMLKDERFVSALRATGQYYDFVNGKPINEKSVLAIMNKN